MRTCAIILIMGMLSCYASKDESGVSKADIQSIGRIILHLDDPLRQEAVHFLLITQTSNADEELCHFLQTDPTSFFRLMHNEPDLWKQWLDGLKANDLPNSEARKTRLLRLLSLLKIADPIDDSFRILIIKYLKSFKTTISSADADDQVSNSDKAIDEDENDQEDDDVLCGMQALSDIAIHGKVLAVREEAVHYLLLMMGTYAADFMVADDELCKVLEADPKGFFILMHNEDRWLQSRAPRTSFAGWLDSLETSSFHAGFIYEDVPPLKARKIKLIHLLSNLKLENPAEDHRRILVINYLKSFTVTKVD